jgi:hypothetical protein
MGFVASGPRQYAVLGRHHCADIRADETMSGISLRQALLRVRQEAGRLVLHVLDLHSTHGLRLLDGTPAGALEIRGPVALTVAGHLLVCVPEHLHEPLPESLPAPELLRLRDALPGPPPRVSEGGRLPVAAGDVREQSADRPGTYVRARGASTLLSAIPLQPLERDARSQLEVNVDRAHERDATLLRVTLAQRALGVLALSKSVLETGVLVGRYERCWNQAGAGVSLPNEVSRVHALLLREGPELLLFDLASSNGTERNGHAVRCAALTPGDVLGLSDQLEFRVL